MSEYITFVNQKKPDYNTSDYDGGIVTKVENYYCIGYAQKGAESSYSIGQPVFDTENNLMGYLGIILLDHLNYAFDACRVPVECWGILLPTEYCKAGKKVKGYWQKLEEEGEENE